MKNIVSRILSVHKEHELLLRLETAGLNDELVQRVIDSKDNNLAMKVVRLIQSGGFEPTTSQKRAREIMGKNFFGIEEAIKCFGVNSNRQQLAALSEIPFSEAILKESKDTHVLVAVFPLSILEIRGKQSDARLFYDQSWYNQEAFAKERGEAGWHLIRKNPVDNSFSKTWDEQQALLSKNEEVPSARVMAYTIIGHYLANHERFFKNVYVRTSSMDSDGNHVYLGSFDECGLNFGRWYDNCRHGSIGLASSRKF